MSTESSDRILVVVRRAPYGSSLPRVGLDTALAAAAFDQPVDILFMGDGVLHLQGEQDSSNLGVKNSGRLLASFPMYDIEQVYAQASAAERYCLPMAATPLPVVLVNDQQIRALMLDCQPLLGF